MRTRLFLLAGTLTAIPASALGQMTTPTSQTAIDVQNYWPSSGPQQAISLRSSDIQRHLSLSFGLVGNFMWRPLVFRERVTGQQHDAVRYALTTDFVWGFGLFDRVQIGVAVPLVVAQEGEGISAITGGGIEAQLPLTALRDIRFDIGIGLLQRARRTNSEGLGLRVDLGGAIPTGDERGYQGAAGWTFAPMVVADYRVSGFTVTANLGARIREVAAVGNIAWASQGVVGIGVSYRPSVLDRLLVGVDYFALPPLYRTIEVVGMNGGGRPVAALAGPLPMELFFGARYAVDRARDIEVSLGGGAPLTSEATVPAYRLLASISYTPRGLDNDGDTVLDADDECPAQPEDRDGFEDTDGCIDPDNDNDRILDPADRCPNAPEDYDNFHDEDGCPEADNDEDGVLDEDDQCSTEAAGAHPDPNHAGCPIRDRDGDGVLDAEDRCPDEAAGEFADPTHPGCAIADRDHDRVADDEDRCPADPQGTRPDRFRPGCPDPDRDHDAVPNELDRCPDEAETINGLTDDDGCADPGDPATSWAGNVLIFDNAIRLRRRLVALRPADVSILVQAAQRIRARGAEVARVRVEVVPEPRTSGAREAERLAGLAADVLVANGVPRNVVDVSASAPDPVAAPAPGARPTRGVPAAAATSVGELRIRIEPRTSAPRNAAPAAPVSAPTSTPPVTSTPAAISPSPSSGPASR